ncbi:MULTISPECIES: FAD-binding oxidoreductase [unclassified Mucilaginibacter]|uniref:FAD-binding oxidoreductase n=1 Tax=unclassified Mucilaginibacter TaxID=2617802 RepID=UPI00095B4A8C|nr:MULTISPECIES: FAD-linked oxidase C-terminal domain-containing protein [unclassified Mucilaginibacter]OJW18086.1 MAG: FAD-binding oxidoreductase [Mucilaginibacter sp. 44-25]PLW90323.1 MAG: FAD-binding oxidoreductase [Mucilaginibacter sp.]HEK19932.1 FAD-binding protein [Bacteroidota bacterium]
MDFNKITEDILSRIEAVVGDSAVVTTKEEVADYSHDETEDLIYYPEVVAKPQKVEHISALLKICNEALIPVTVRGAGTGLAGGALPVKGGLLISMERFNNIIEIDEQNLQATVEPGVITEVFMNAVAEKGLLYPVDPASKGSCFIGGNVANCSGGPRVVKYGTIREYVLNLEVVLPNGDVIWTGANTLKYASGYNLTQLMIGSEGTLGVVTKIVTKLIPRPTQDVLMLASFPTNEDACAAVSAIFRAGVIPSALEFMERRGMEWVIEHDGIAFDLKDGIGAFLLIEVDGSNQDVIFGDCEVINGVLEAHNCADVLFADSAAQKEELWRIRRTMAVSVKSNSVYKEEDTVVPRAALPQLIKGIKEIGAKYGFESVCYGHAGDGNLHVNIVKAGMSDADWNNKLKDGITEIFKLTISLGGTLSGEHGIGLVQKDYMPLKYTNTHFLIWKGIKQVFDPNGILNPGKIFN